ncbi:Hypothetical protein A7982_02122 [Minicystis rosea]|nr:Hypothetical protein A7982_02122 [Minicystis rosea]
MAKPDIATGGPLCTFPIAFKAEPDKLRQKSTVDGELFSCPKLTGRKLE